jgi:hypothetical protein
MKWRSWAEFSLLWRREIPQPLTPEEEAWLDSQRNPSGSGARVLDLEMKRVNYGRYRDRWIIRSIIVALNMLVIGVWFLWHWFLDLV